VAIDLEDFVRAIVDDRVAGSGAAIAGDENAALELESQDRGGLGEGNVGPRLRGTYRTYRTYVFHPSQHADEIFPSASGWVHLWPVRWR
jgi:hypothetical protein